jgi:hypothetical protein
MLIRRLFARLMVFMIAFAVLYGLAALFGLLDS